jgi:hypothetical protein
VAATKLCPAGPQHLYPAWKLAHSGGQDMCVPMGIERVRVVASDAEAIEALRDLAGTRNTAAHEQRDHQFPGEYLAMWVSACRWLVDGA